MYYLIRTLLFALIIIICISVISIFRKRKNKALVQKTYIIAACICAPLLFFSPIENLFLRFESPREAFMYSKQNKIVKIIEYKDYAVIIHDGSPEYTILWKDSKGWLIENQFASSTSYSSINIDNSITIVYRHIDPNTLFVYVLIPASPNDFSQVTDSSNTRFEFSQKRNGRAAINVYYGFAQSTEDYCLFVNNKEVPIK